MIETLATCPADTRRLVVALSGGRDSIALLHALAHSGVACPIHAVHVCHHLDPDAEAWADFCAREAAERGVALTRLDVAVDRRCGGLEAAARDARYAALAEMLAPGDVLVAAHHARDQAETVLIQAMRGAGMRGLAAMPALAPLGAGRLWRPWRHVAAQAIADYAAEQNLTWVEDPSNADPARDRAWLAASVWPALVGRRAGVEAALTRVAAHAAEAVEAIEALAAVDHEGVRAPQDTLSVDGLAELSPARTSAVIRRWLAEQGAAPPDHRHLAEIRRLLTAREHAGPRVRFGVSEVRRFDARLFVMPRTAPPPAVASIAWSRAETLVLPGDAGALRLAEGAQPAVWPETLSVGFRRGGERLPRADGTSRALSAFLRESRLPPWMRERMPLVYCGDTLIAVADRWRMPRCARFFGGVAPRFRWSHELVGDPLRVVGYGPMG